MTEPQRRAVRRLSHSMQSAVPARKLRNDVRALQERMDARFEQLQEQMRHMQTELLKAFLPTQKQHRLRDCALEARENAPESRMSTVENRLWEIRKKLLRNPPAV